MLLHTKIIKIQDKRVNLMKIQASDCLDDVDLYEKRGNPHVESGITRNKNKLTYRFQNLTAKKG